MVVSSKELVFRASKCRLLANFALALGFFCLLCHPIQAASPNQPTLTILPFGCGYLLVASNCTDTNIQYVTQSSTDLRNWSPIATNQGASANFSNAVVATNSFACFRLMANPGPGPIFQAAIITVSNLDLKGNGNIIDSFDSSDTNYSTAGQYDPTKRKANGNVASPSSIVGDISLGNATIYGYVFTGPGTTQTAVQIAPNCSTGDLAWVNTSLGIESNHWAGNYNARFPDVPTPTWSGLGLPAPNSNGIINLTLSNGLYITSTFPNYPLLVWVPSKIWVQGSVGLSPTSIVFTNRGSLVLYVGTTNASGGDLMTFSGPGTINAPGYAANLQIFGLPSLTSISLGNANAIIGCIYAPEANLSGGDAGLITANCAGSIVANTLISRGGWKFHFDESLLLNGPSR